MLKQEELDSIRVYKYLPCELEFAVLNDVMLSDSDFGEMVDTGDRDDEEDEEIVRWGCIDLHFVPYKEVKSETLIKYNLTEEEYRRVQEKLSDLLYVGRCGLCI